MPQKLQQAIDAIKSGNKETGKQLLIEVLKADRRNENAWLWMVEVVSTNEERIKCFENILRINPNNEMAKQGLAVLQQKQINEPPSQDKSIVNSKLKRIKPVSISTKSTVELTKQCPYCAEKIKAEAKVCRFCNRDLETDFHKPQQDTVLENNETNSHSNHVHKTDGAKPKSSSKAFVVILLGVCLGLCGFCVFIQALLSPIRKQKEMLETRPQIITTSEGDRLNIPGIGYADGRTRSGSSTMITLGVWDMVPRQRVVCRLQHGTKVDILEVTWLDEQWEYGDGRYYFLIDEENGECRGWMPENFLSAQYAAPTGELVP